jgi:hypothetical protein
MGTGASIANLAMGYADSYTYARGPISVVELNAALDLHKSDAQATDSPEGRDHRPSPGHNSLHRTNSNPVSRSICAKAVS